MSDDRDADLHFERIREVVAPLLKRMDDAEASMADWREQSDAVAAQQRAEGIRIMEQRFRVNIATELLAASRAWAIEQKFDSGDEFIAKACRVALRAADVLLAESAKP